MLHQVRRISEGGGERARGESAIQRFSEAARQFCGGCGENVAEMMTNTSESFRCPECGQQVEDGVTEMVFDFRDTNVTVRNVPAKICPSCGQEFVDGYVAENVNRLVDRVVEDVDSYAKKTVRSPVTPRQIAITPAFVEPVPHKETPAAHL